jgi:hypothetical protein
MMYLNLKDQLINFEASGLFTMGHLVHREGIVLGVSPLKTLNGLIQLFGSGCKVFLLFLILDF